ncbi:hypothetical protein CHUAL_012775 [Chamberlinius hualienensis]
MIQNQPHQTTRKNSQLFLRVTSSLKQKFKFVLSRQHYNVGNGKKKMFLISGFVMVATLYQCCLAYSSVESIKKAYAVDKNIAETLEKHLKSIDNFKTTVKEYIDEHSLLQLENDENSIVSNPLAAYQIIRRIVLNKQQISNQINQIAKELTEQLDELTNSIGYSYNDHLMEASEGLLRLQDTYRLHPMRMIEGKIRNINSTVRLTLSDCLILAEGSVNALRYDFQVQWLELAHRYCLTQTKPSQDVCRYTTEHLYESAKLQHDETREWLMTEKNPQQNEQGDSMIVLRNATTTVTPLKQRTNEIENGIYTGFDREKFLCHKGSLLKAKTAAKLHCYYLRRKRNVYITLQRFRVEQRSILPTILTIYNIINDKEIQLIKNLSIPKLNRSRVIAESEDKEVSKVRVSETGWLSEDEHPNLEVISRRISDVTGLKVDQYSSEEYQVVNYGIGGLYKAHHDYLQDESGTLEVADEDDWQDDRLATFILYLNDVELGGATVFPLARVAVPAIKGAATFWYNLNATGHPDELTLHGGCPVLYGSKWIANKWIHSDSQMFTRRCPTRLH